MESIATPMASYTVDNGFKVRCMAKVKRRGLMALNTWVTTAVDRRKAQEPIYGLMAPGSTVNGNITR